MKNLTLKTKFGSIKVNEKEYKKDIVIHSDGSITKREKKKSKDLKPEYGHTPLSERELEFLKKEKFEALYIGTGHQASLPITRQAKEILDKYKATVLPTPEVIDRIVKEQRKFVAIIHITC